MYLRSNRITNTSPSLCERSMKSFLAITIKSTSRNLWFRLLRNRIPAKASLRHIFNLPDGRCLFYGYPETASHLLFTCPALFEIWRNFIVLFFAFCPPLDMQSIYRSAIAFQALSNLCLLDSYLKVSPLEVVTCIYSSIWSAHWRFHFDAISIVAQSVLDSATKEVRYLSALNQFRQEFHSHFWD